MNFKVQLFLLCNSLSLLSCTGLVFQPDNQDYIDLELNNVIYQDIYFTTENNVKLHGWYLPSRKSIVHGTVLFLHGNAQNISSHINSVFWLPHTGFNVFLFDYQGYGKSEGQTTLAGVQHDFHAALAWLIKNESVDNKKIIVFGQSLGASIALYALSNSKYKNLIRGMVSDSGFTSYRNITRDFLDNFWLTWAFQWPLSFTVSDDFPAIDAIPKISPVPLLLIHSKDDEVIPYAHGEALFKAAKSPKLFWSLEHVKHIQVFSLESNRQLFVAHLKSMLNNTFPVINKQNR